jgi:hypothetical protein
MLLKIQVFWDDTFCQEGTIYPKNTNYKPRATTTCFNIVSSSLLINRSMPEADSSRYRQIVKFSDLFHFIYWLHGHCKWKLHCIALLHLWNSCFYFNMKFLSHLI